MSRTFRVEPFDLLEDGVEQVQAEPVGGDEEQGARADVWRAVHPEGWWLRIGFLAFPMGEQQVQCIGYGKGVPQPLHRLSHGLRMVVLTTESGQRFVELRQARLKKYQPSFHSTLRKATEQELDRGAGESVRQVLVRHGLQVGTRSEVIGDTGRQRGFMCAVAADVVPEGFIAAFMLTRVLPLYMEYLRHEGGR